VNRWQAFVEVCNQLRNKLLDGAPAPITAGIHWEYIISVSSRHYVTPALAWCLRESVGIPPDVHEYFDATLALNRRRNEFLLAALRRIVTVLNASNIEPLLLKGVSHLIDGTYPHHSLRFLGDIDFMVPEDKAVYMAKRLAEVGFVKDPNSPIGPSHHHLPVLLDRETGVAVEIHTDAVPSIYREIVPSAWMWEKATPFPFHNLRVRLPDPTRRVALNIVHDQLTHNQYQRHGAELRQLLDLAFLRARREDEIDWPAIDSRFCAAGAGQTLSTYLELARGLLGQRAPQLSCAPRRETITGFRRRMGTWRTVRRLANDYVSARRREPLGFLRLFGPRTWSSRVRLIKSGFDTAV
jgi:hypothetical protein